MESRRSTAPEEAGMLKYSFANNASMGNSASCFPQYFNGMSSHPDTGIDKYLVISSSNDVAAFRSTVNFWISWVTDFERLGGGLVWSHCLIPSVWTRSVADGIVGDVNVLQGSFEPAARSLSTVNSLFGTLPFRTELTSQQPKIDVQNYYYSLAYKSVINRLRIFTYLHM